MEMNQIIVDNSSEIQLALIYVSTKEVSMEETGKAGPDLIVNKKSQNDQRLGVTIQKMNQSSTFIISFLTIDIENNNN